MYIFLYFCKKLCLLQKFLLVYLVITTAATAAEHASHTTTHSRATDQGQQDRDTDDTVVNLLVQIPVTDKEGVLTGLCTGPQVLGALRHLSDLECREVCEQQDECFNRVE